MTFIHQKSEILEEAFKALSENYKGNDVDLYAICKENRENHPIMEGDFMRSLNVPTHADVRHTHPTYALFKYKDIRKVLSDAKTFTSGFIKDGLGQFFGGDGLIILAMDGDQHRKIRSMLQPVFMPANVKKWKDEIDRVVREEFIIPRIADKKADLMEFGLYFPIRIIYQLIGFPDDMREKFYEYAAMGLAILAGPTTDQSDLDDARARANEASQTLLDQVIELVARRRAEGAEGDDLISQLIRAEFEGEKFTDYEITTFARSLVAAGGETTTRTFSSMMTLLLERPELLERVRQDRSLVSKVINEAIRFEPVATVKIRQAATDVEIGGVHIPKGAMIQAIVASANRDEEVYENADEFNIDRKQSMSLTFGFGPHMCIGQFVAKLELEAALNAILDLFPNIRQDPDKESGNIVGGQLRGASNVHAVWD